MSIRRLIWDIKMWFYNLQTKYRPAVKKDK